MRCLKCRYDLRNLSEHRCPECGRAFDPDDPTTYATPASQVQRMMRIACGLAARVLLTAALSLLVVYGLVCLSEGRIVAAWRRDDDDFLNVVMNWPFAFVLMLVMYAVALRWMRYGQRSE